MDGAVGLEVMETGENTKECCGLSEWEQPGDNASLHRLASIVPGMGGIFQIVSGLGRKSYSFTAGVLLPVLD